MPLRPPYEFVAEIAPGADPSAKPSTWEYTSSGVKWRTKAGVTINAGRDDEDSTVEPGKIDLTFDDRTGKLSPRNVMGEWYGKINRDTPMRFVLTTAADTFSRTVSGGWGDETLSGRPWAHTSAAAFSVNGSVGRVGFGGSGFAGYALVSGGSGRDVDVYSSVSIDSMPTGAAWVSATVVRYADVSNHYRVHTEFLPSGGIQVKVSRLLGGILNDLAFLTVPGLTYTAGQQVHTHVRAIGRTIQTRVWVGSTEPLTWHLSVDDDAVLGYAVGMYQWRLATNAGSLSISVDNFRVVTSVWSGQVPEWPVRWPDRSGKDTVAPITGAGLLRWLTSNNRPPVSPLTQYNATLPKTRGSWSLEDGPDVLALSSKMLNGIPATFVDVTPGSDDAPPGAASAVTLNTAGVSKINARILKYDGTDAGFQTSAYFRFPALPASDRLFFEAYGSGDGARYAATVGPAGLFTLNVYDPGGALFYTSSSIVPAIDLTRWFGFAIVASQTGGSTVTWKMTWFQVGFNYGLTTSGTHAGIQAGIVGGGIAAPVDGTLVSQWWMGDKDFDFVNADVIAAADAFRGETDVARIRRALGAVGVQPVIEGTEGVPLGPEPRSATVMEVLRDAEQAGLGVLYEAGPTIGYIPRAARSLPPVSMALTWGVHLSDGPEPTDDDLPLVTTYTAKRPSGGEVTYSDTSTVGVYRDYPAGDDHNVLADTQLGDIAGWKVTVGTSPKMRWPKVNLSMHATPELIPLWLSCRVGSRITISNLPGVLRGEVVDLIIEGYQQTINKMTWDVELNCVPAYPWINAALVDAADVTVDTERSAMAAQASASATSISIKTVDGPRWVTTAEDPAAFPFYVNISGIRVQVTGVSGTTSPQTFTVVRNVDGYDKILPLDADVRLWSSYVITP